jgi:heme-degrading monooxygenase HmoA
MFELVAIEPCFAEVDQIEVNGPFSPSPFLSSSRCNFAIVLQPSFYVPPQVSDRHRRAMEVPHSLSANNRYNIQQLISEPRLPTPEIIMITVGMNYHVLPGKQADFEQKFAAVIDALKAAEGHSSSTLWKDTSDDASYLITSEWSDEQAFRDFIQSQAFRDVTTWGKEQILSTRPQHKVYKH